MGDKETIAVIKTATAVLHHLSIRAQNTAWNNAASVALEHCRLYTEAIESLGMMINVFKFTVTNASESGKPLLDAKGKHGWRLDAVTYTTDEGRVSHGVMYLRDDYSVVFVDNDTSETVEVAAMRRMQNPAEQNPVDMFALLQMDDLPGRTRIANDIKTSITRLLADHFRS